MYQDLALLERNKRWESNSFIPNWVDLQEVGLDQFFTKPEIAIKCHDSLVRFMREDGAEERNYKFVEPSAGTGTFYNLLPENRRIGIDILPLHSEIERGDFLSWIPPKNGHSYALIGNPPFGYRAWLALAFMNHAATFADYVGMILPMAFQSDGKGSPKHRVKGLKLVHMEFLPQNSFVDTEGKDVKINALWQVWQRGVNNLSSRETCNNWLDLFTVDMRKERLCGHRRLAEADCFLQRTFYGEPPTLVKSFSEVRYVCGYGLVFKREKRKILNILKQADW